MKYLLGTTLAAVTMFAALAPNEAEAKQNYCRQEYCAKKAPRKVVCSGLFCVPRLVGGQCLQTGVRIVKC